MGLAKTPLADALADEIEEQLRNDPTDRIPLPLRSRLEHAAGIARRFAANRLSVRLQVADLRQRTANLLTISESVGAEETLALRNVLAILDEEPPEQKRSMSTSFGRS